MASDEAVQMDAVDLGARRCLRNISLVALEKRTDVALLERVEEAPAGLGIRDARVHDIQRRRQGRFIGRVEYLL